MATSLHRSGFHLTAILTTMIALFFGAASAQAQLDILGGDSLRVANAARDGSGRVTAVLRNNSNTSVNPIFSRIIGNDEQPVTDVVREGRENLTLEPFSIGTYTVRLPAYDNGGVPDGAMYLVVRVFPEDEDAAPRMAIKPLAFRVFEARLWWLAPIAAAVTIVISVGYGIVVAVRTGIVNPYWIASAPTFSFRDTWATISGFVLSAANLVLVGSFAPLAAGSADPRAVLGAVFALPVLLAPVVFTIFGKPTTDDERKLYLPPEKPPMTKVNFVFFAIASWMTLTGVLWQLSVLYEWLGDVNFAFVFGDGGSILIYVIPLIAAFLLIAHAVGTISDTFEHNGLRRPPPEPSAIAESAGEREIKRLRRASLTATTSSRDHWPLL